MAQISTIGSWASRERPRQFMHLPMRIAVLLMFVVPSARVFANCGDLQTQAEMNRCAAEEYAKVDRELNRIYNDYRSGLSEDQKRELRDAQLAWVRFRDSWCNFEGSGARGGSVYPLILNSCLADMTRARIQQITALARCKEGDVSCPAWK